MELKQLVIHRCVDVGNRCSVLIDTGVMEVTLNPENAASMRSLFNIDLSNAASLLEDTLGGSEQVVGDVLTRMAPESSTSLDYSKTE